MSIRAVARCLALGFTLGVLSDRAAAELPPDAYRAKQQAAPEFVEIKVRSVAKTKVRKSDHQLVTNLLEADVQKVHRTATSLQPGAKIRIRYTQRINARPMPGPSEVPALKKGQLAPAYLAQTKGEKTYAPAAGGYSFETVGRN